MKKGHVREGQIVRVVDGPLTGFRSEVKEVDEQTSIAKVAVQAFGRVASIDLALGKIELVPEIKTEALPGANTGKPTTIETYAQHHHSARRHNRPCRLRAARDRSLKCALTQNRLGEGGMVVQISILKWI